MKVLTDLLQAAHEDQSRNVLTEEQVKTSLNRYLAIHDEEVANFPQEANVPHWNLLAADYDSNKEAMFLLAFFKNTSITLLTGRGSGESVREFSLNDFPTDSKMILDEVVSRFWIAGQATITYESLTSWLNS